MGVFNPSEQELQETGLSRSAYLENWFALYKLSGVILWSKPFTWFFHVTRCLAILTMSGFIIGSGLEGDKETSFESLQYLLLVVMMYSGAVSFWYYQEELLTIYRSLGFDYEGTLDQSTEQDILKIREEASKNKEGFKNIARVLIIGTVVALLGKKPLGYLLRGRGAKLLDGENNLMYNSAFGSYMPFAHYWGPYIFGLVFSYLATFWFIFSHNGYLVSFQFTSEELLAEFKTVNTTLSNCVIRAKMLHSKRLSEKRGNGLKVDETLEDCLKFCLHLSIKHHHQILRSLSLLKQIMYVPMLVMILCWAMVTCLSVYLLLSEDVSMDFKLPLPVLIFAEAVVAFLFCHYGELLSNATESIAASIYDGGDWIGHSIYLRPYIIIMSSSCQSQNALSACGFSPLNHATFGNMVSTAYSYMGFLLSS